MGSQIIHSSTLKSKSPSAASCFNDVFMTDVRIIPAYEPNTRDKKFRFSHAIYESLLSFKFFLRLHSEYKTSSVLWKDQVNLLLQSFRSVSSDLDHSTHLHNVPRA